MHLSYTSIMIQFEQIMHYNYNITCKKLAHTYNIYTHRPELRYNLDNKLTIPDPIKYWMVCSMALMLTLPVR